MSEDTIQVDEIMKHFDDVLKQHYDEGEDSVLATPTLSKNDDQEQKNNERYELYADNNETSQFGDGQCEIKVKHIFIYK